MTKFSVLLSKSAIKTLSSLENSMQSRIKTALKELEIDPFVSRPKVDIKKLYKVSKHHFFRLRVGNYRIVYVIENTYIKVTEIFPREKGYDWLD